MLREWVQRAPEEASREYAAGIRFTDVNHVVAGVAEPPGPAELRELTDSILRGVFAGDFAVALQRAAAFCRVEDDHVLFDLRTVTEEQVPDLARAILYAIEGDEFLEED